MENCARIFKQFGFKHVLERSWKAMRPQGKSPRPNHHLDQGHFHLLGTSELRWQLLLRLVSSAKSKHGVIAVKNSDGLDQWSIRRDNRHSLHFATDFEDSASCCNRMLWPNGRPLHVWKFWFQLLFSDQHTAGNSSSASAWDSKCDKRGNSCVSLSSWCLSLPPGRTAWLWEKHLLKSLEILVIPNSFH